LTSEFAGKFEAFFLQVIDWNVVVERAFTAWAWESGISLGPNEVLYHLEPNSGGFYSSSEVCERLSFDGRAKKTSAAANHMSPVHAMHHSRNTCGQKCGR